jgi:hypothetical protein
MADGSERPVRIREVNTSRVVVVADEWGMASAVGSGAEEFELLFPALEELIVRQGGGWSRYTRLRRALDRGARLVSIRRRRRLLDRREALDRRGTRTRK